MPSLEENLSNVMLEAMACATPVFGFCCWWKSRCHQKRHKWFFSSGYDTAKFADLLLELIFNRTLREQMGYNGRSLIEEKFKIRDQAAGYLELFGDLLKKSKISTGVTRGYNSNHKN